MLVVGRREGEGILIGENITIVIVQCKNGSCRLGIDAPRDVRILRRELQETDDAEIEEESEEDSQTKTDSSEAFIDEIFGA